MSADIANWLQVNIVNNPQVLKSLIALGILIGAGFLMFGKPTKKIPSKRARRILGAALFVFAVFVFLRANIADLADVFIVWATIILAGVAVFSFEESRRLRKQYGEQGKNDRKERLLNEIIIWLRGLENRIFPSSGGIITVTKEVQEKIDYKEKLGLSLEIWQSLMNLDKAIIEEKNLGREIRDGEYIQKLALGLQSDLGRLIEITLGHLKERRDLVSTQSQYHTRNEKENELITELIKDEAKSLEGLTLSENARNTVLLGRNAGVIRRSILDAIDKTIEIRTSLLSI